MDRIYKTTEARRARVAKYLNSEKGKATRLGYVLSGKAATNSKKSRAKPEIRERRKLQGREWYKNHKILKIAIYSNVADL